MLQGCTVSSYSMCHPPGPKGPSPQSCFPTGRVPSSPGAWGYSHPGAGHAFQLAELHEIPASPFLQLVQVPLNGSTTLRRINLSPQFVSPPSQSLLTNSKLDWGTKGKAVFSNLNNNTTINNKLEMTWKQIKTEFPEKQLQNNCG